MNAVLFEQFSFKFILCINTSKNEKIKKILCLIRRHLLIYHHISVEISN